MNSKNAGGRLERFLTGSGFYIVLFLCAAVIGVSAWMTALGSARQEPLQNEPGMSARRIETVIITPAPQPDRIETMAGDDGVAAPVSELPEQPAAQQTMAEPVTLWPVDGDVERAHDLQTLHYDVTLRDWRTHEGVDIEAPLGQTVMAARSGVVRSVDSDSLYGTVVTVDHGDGSTARYANLAAQPAVAAGEYVEAGQVLGAVGSTALCEIGQGTHLHFAVMQDGESIDPLEFLPERV